jgi:hypothetical protein
MWHGLADHRYELTLGPLDAANTLAAITKFEKELGEKLNPVLRRQVAESSRGLPWLLKILCIHLLEQIESGKSQAELVDGALDAKTLFDRQLQSLSGPETSCLRTIAASAPADWYEVIEAYGADVLRGLLDKRLVVRSGDRVAVYWDIFREYLLTASVPHVPVTYLPASPSPRALLALAARLRRDSWVSIAVLAEFAGVAPNTAGNIVRDLVMLGIATRNGDTARLADATGEGQEAVLFGLRDALKRHALAAALRHLPDGAVITRDVVVGMLRVINPAAHHRRQTWEMYADRLLHLFHVTGFLAKNASEGWRWADSGKARLDAVGPRPRPHGTFTAAAPPESAVRALEWFESLGSATVAAAEKAGFRNAVHVLCSLGILCGSVEGLTLAPDYIRPINSRLAVWQAAWSNPLLRCLRESPGSERMQRSGIEIGAQAAKILGVEWSDGSLARYGNALGRWCEWLDGGSADVPAPFPIPRQRPKSRRASAGDGSQGSLFDLS